MSFDPSTFWSACGTKMPPLNDDLVAGAESVLKVKLPAEYLELLRLQNGGSTAGWIFPTATRTSWADDHVPFEDMCGIAAADDEKNLDSILSSTYMSREWELPPSQVLLTGDGHWWITLDYRKSEVPCVSWIDVEMEEEAFLAASFREFLQGLRTPDPD